MQESNNNPQNTINHRDKIINLDEQNRSERLEKLSALVTKLFPGDNLALLRANIERSFSVPQYGKYHHEGMFMDSHLDEILSTIEKVKVGEFPAEIPAEIREILQGTVQNNSDSLAAYTFLHDISKADCLCIQTENGEDKDLTWEEWQNSLPEKAKKSPQALKEFFEANHIKGISYHHHEQQHGNLGVNVLEPNKANLNLPNQLYKAIDKHEVAFMFQTISLATYKKHLGELTPEERSWALTASYLDTSATFSSNGKPDYTNFLALAGSFWNLKIYEESENLLKKLITDDQDIDAKIAQDLLEAFGREKQRYPSTATDLVENIRKKALIPTFNFEKLSSALENLILTNQITAEEKLAILNCLEPSGRINPELYKSIKQGLGKKNKIIEATLQANKN